MSEILIDDEEFHMLHTAYWSTMFETIVHPMVLPGGQKQRVAIASAIAADKEFVLMMSLQVD